MFRGSKLNGKEAVLVRPLAFPTTKRVWCHVFLCGSYPPPSEDGLLFLIESHLATWPAFSFLFVTAVTCATRLSLSFAKEDYEVSHEREMNEPRKAPGSKPPFA